MPQQQSVVEDPVLLLQALEEGVLPERRIARHELIVSPFTLFFEGIDLEREASCEAECLALLEGERGTLVPPRTGQDRLSSQSGPVLLLRLLGVGHGGCDKGSIADSLRRRLSSRGIEGVT